VSTLAARPDEGPSQVTSLEEAIALAYRRNPTLLAERATVRANDEEITQARGAYGPQAGLSGGVTFTDDSTRIAGLRNPLNRSGTAADVALSLQQTIFSSGRNYARLFNALATVDFARENLRAVEGNVLTNVIRAYVAVRRDDILVGISRENLDLLSRQYRDTAERYRVREITIADLQQAETRTEFARSQLLEAEGQLQVSRSAFLRFVGAVPEELAPLPELPGVPDAIANAYDVADEASPLILGARARERGSRATVVEARAEFGPELGVRGSFSNSPASPFSNDQRQQQVRGEVLFNVPLFDSGLRRSRERQATEINSGDRRLVDQAVRDVRQLVAQAWTELVASRTSLDNYAASVRAAEAAFEGAVIQERAGLRTTLEVLDLARDLLGVRTSFVQAQANEYLARVALLSAMGRLEARYLLTGVELYDPKVNYNRVATAGDVPWTPLLVALDGVFAPRNLREDRALRDDAAALRLEGSEPLPPPPPPGP
jgi:TolC family type I secretion outer membrane protein